MDAALIVIVVALGDAEDPATRAMTRTTQEVLGDTSLVIVREVPKMPTDEAALELEASTHATAIVELVWSADRRNATLRVHARNGAWTERTVPFVTTDVPSERGRSLAYTASVMMPPPSPPSPSPSPTPSPGPTLPPPPMLAPPVTREVVPPSPLFAADVSARLSTAAGDERGTTGFSAGFALVPSAFGVRLSVAARRSSIDAASATTNTLQLGGGPMITARWSFLAFALRPEVSLARLSVSRSPLGAAPASSDARWLPTTSLTGELGVIGAGGAIAFLGVGVERALGVTNVRVGDLDVAAFGRTRALFELGIRLRF